MEVTIGKALRDARLKKGLTPEEVAKATKIRVDWVTDLENEDYHRFPSLGYARNFQILYAKYLEVEFRATAMVEPGKRVLATSFDHIYEGVTPVGYRGIQRRQPIRRSRWLMVFIVFSIACIVGGITAFSILDILRLPSWEEMMGEEKEATERVVVEPVEPPLPEATPAAQPSPTPEEKPEATEPPAPPIFQPSPLLKELRQNALPEKAEPFRMVPPSATITENLEIFSYASDAEALSTPFPVGSSDEADALEESTPAPTSAGREPTEAPAADAAPTALPNDF